LTLALSGVLLAACATAPTLTSEAPTVQAAAQGCERPPLDDAAALIALESGLAPISLSGALVNRFAAANREMEAAASAANLAAASCAAENVLFVLAGRFGRHAPPDAISPGILPADRDPLSDPGVAISAMMIVPDPPAAEAIGTGIVGKRERWSKPTDGWGELDAAVASGTVADLDSKTMQAIGWALLVQRASNLDEARGHARAGVAATSTALQAARQALAISCATFPEALCRQ
jgi:hypothetical protein